MTRRCSHCSNNGHNSRTCPTRGGGGGPGSSGGSGSGAGVKLFGVRLTDGSIMKKSASMGNLSGNYNSSSSAAASPNHPGSPSSHPFHDPVHLPDGYASDDPTNANHRGERKKGVPWTEEEHRLFLLGLQQLGKGDWRGISRNFVTSRTPTQVASHAQKYFIRQSNATRRKRRSSLFDMVPESADSLALTEEQYMLPPQVVDSSKQQLLVLHSQALEDDNEKSQPSLDLSLKPDLEPMEATPSEPVEEDTKEIVTPLPEFPSVFPSFSPAFIPVPFPMWQSNVTFQDQGRGAEVSQHKILKPIPVLPKEPINVDELVGMSHLSLRDVVAGPAVPSPLSITLTAESSRQSAFHASTPVKETTISKGESIV